MRLLGELGRAREKRRTIERLGRPVLGPGTRRASGQTTQNYKVAAQHRSVDRPTGNSGGELRFYQTRSFASLPGLDQL